MVTMGEVPGLLGNFVANAAADLCVGPVLALLGAFLAWQVGKRLNLFEQAEERRQRLARESARAAEWMTLLSDEVGRMVKFIPEARTAVLSKPWGMIFNVGTPIWALAQLSGEVARLVDPGVLGDLSRVYEALADVETWVPLIAQSWMVDERHVVNAPAKRTALVGMVVQALDKAGDAADGLEKRMAGEIARLSKAAARLGGCAASHGEAPEQLPLDD